MLNFKSDFLLAAFTTGSATGSSPAGNCSLFAYSVNTQF